MIYRKKHCPSLSAPERKAVLGRRYKGRRTVQIRGEVIAQRYKRLCKIDDVVNLCFQHTRPQGWKCVKNSFFTKLIQKVKVSKVLPLKKVVAEKKTLLKKMKKTTPVVAVDLDKQRIKKEMAAQKERQRIAEEQRVAEQQRQKTKALESAAKKAVAAKEEKIKEQAALNQEVEEVQNKGEAPDLFEGGRKAEYVGRLIEKIKPLLKKVFVREKSNTEHCVNRVRSISILDPDIKKRYKGMSSKKVQILGNAIVTYIQLAADHCLDIQSAGVQGLKVSTFKEHYSKKYGAEVSIDDAVLKDYNSLIEIENRTEDLVKPNQQRYIDLNHDFIEAMVDMKEYADSTENQDQHYFDDWRAMLFFAQLDELAFESEELFELAQKMLGSK